MKEGDCAQRISQVTEVWKGRYKDEVVALKVLRVPRDDPQVQRTKSVSMSGKPSEGGLLTIVLTDDIAVLQGSSIDETGQT